MEIRYYMTRSEDWRFNLTTALRRPMFWALLVIYALLITWYAYWQYPLVQASLHLRSPHFWWLPSLFFGICAGMLSVFLGVIWERVSNHYPDTEPRPVSVSILTSDYMQGTQRKMKGSRLVLVPMQIPWQEIVEIEWHQGSIYFHRKSGASVIPQSAFDNPRHAQHYLDTARFYWQSAKDGAPVTDTQSVWPPAPRL